MKQPQRPLTSAPTRPRRFQLAAAGTLAALLICVDVAAAVPSCSPEQSLHWRGTTLRLENDLFAGTDRNYTNGVALALISRDISGRLRPDCLPRPLALYARFLGRVNPGFWERAGLQSATQNVVLRLGQAMYTPEDNERSDLISDDRSYAGLLYASMAWNRRVHPQGSRYEKLDTRELTLGVIGPAALARQSRNLIHDLRGIDRFRGWHNQLRNEPALQLALERKFKRRLEPAQRLRQLPDPRRRREPAAFHRRPAALHATTDAKRTPTRRAHLSQPGSQSRGLGLFTGRQPAAQQPPRQQAALGRAGRDRRQCPVARGRVWRAAGADAHLAHA